MAVLAVMLTVGACTAQEGSKVPLRSTSTQPGPEAAVEASYKEYWRVEHVTMQLPESEWPSAIGKVAAGAQVDRVVEGFRSLRAQALTLYGSVTPRVSHVDVAGDQATVQDCQDASNAGQADATIGKPKNVGVPRNPITATLTRGSDGQWRVTGVSYPGGTC
jgi:hypothetical protein